MPPEQALLQRRGRLRFGWALDDALALSEHDLPGRPVVVVDVLSFCTTVSVALDRGIEVYPYRWTDERAPGYAEQLSATLARGRRHHGISLSPDSVRTSDGIQRLVLPSPNGATIVAELAARGSRVVAGCLRNSAAVGHWLRSLLDADPAMTVTVIAAGERWPDGSLRPAVEDLWGAGAVLAAIGADVPASPEARAAMAAYAASAPNLAAELRDCAGGQELIGYGFAEDVAIAAELDRSAIVPVLTENRFTAG